MMGSAVGIEVGKVAYNLVGNSVGVSVDSSTGVIQLTVRDCTARLSTSEVGEIIKLLNIACNAVPAIVSAHHTYHQVRDRAALDLESAIREALAGHGDAPTESSDVLYGDPLPADVSR